MLGGFKKHRLVLKGCDIFFVENGKGTPVVLLHGFPQTHAMWANVAPLLSNCYHVICPDLRGYGQSAKPLGYDCLLYTSPSPRDPKTSRMPSSA